MKGGANPSIKKNIPNLQFGWKHCFFNYAKTENYMALNKGKSGRDKRYKQGE